MTKNTVILVSCAICLRAATVLADVPDCEKRFNELNDRISALYISLDSRCYPQGEVGACGAVISDECKSQYDALAAQTSSEYDAFTETCPDYSMSVGVSSDTEIPETFMRAPSKSKMLKDIKGLKKNLREANKKIRSLRHKGSCR